MMSTSQRPELSHDTSIWPQFYHCVIRNIPFELPPPALAEHLMVQDGSEAAKALAGLKRQIVLHTMYTYKEPLNAKFGYMGFFLRCLPEAKTDEETKLEAHELAKQWIKKELTPQLLVGNMQVSLAQPASCYHSLPFLTAFRSQCSIASKDVAPDPMKMETFLFTHTTFDSDSSDTGAAFNPTWAEQGESFEASAKKPATAAGDAAWGAVGTLSVSSLTPQELFWMKKNLSKFPPISITNGDFSTAHIEDDALVNYLAEHLAPFIVVKKD